MNRGAAGWGCPRPGYWSYRRSDDQATSASRGSHRVRRLPSESGRHLASGEACCSPAPKPRSVTLDQDFDHLIKPERFRELKEISDRFGKNYDGRGHGKYASVVKGYTARRKRPLNYQEQNYLIHRLREFKPQTHWSWFSLASVTQSFASAGLFIPQQYTDQAVRNAQTVLLTDLLDAVQYKCNERPEVSNVDT